MNISQNIVQWIEKKILSETIATRLMILLLGVSVSFGMEELSYFNPNRYIDSYVSWIMVWLMAIVTGLCIGIIIYF